MSKKSEARIDQGYERNPIQPMCSNCVSYAQEKNKRCLMGKFAVIKTSTCNKHSFMEEK